jgi:hypothetical protein
MKTIKAKVHRLPSEVGLISECIKPYTEERSWNIGELMPYDDGHIDYWATQHLYITTDEKPKEGEWAYDIIGNDVYQWKKSDWDLERDAYEVRENSRKIIATTDPKLTPNGTTEFGAEQDILMMPQIPQSFIEEYCKAGGIDEVLVEVEDICLTCGKEFNHNTQAHTNCEVQNYCFKSISSLKLNPDNTIIIHPVEENKFEKQKTYILRRLEHCNKRLKQCEEKYNGKEEKHTFHGGRDLGYWQGLVEGYTLQLEWIEENL